jgi:hypothetical protein
LNPLVHKHLGGLKAPVWVYTVYDVGVVADERAEAR